MLPQFHFKRLTRGLGLRTPARCQIVWQLVLVLATAALALASASAHGADSPLRSAPLGPRHAMCMEAQTSGMTPVAEATLKRIRVGAAYRVELLTQILNQREALVRQDLLQARRYFACAASPNQTAVCNEAFRQMLALREKAKMARLLLGASQSQYQWSTWQGRARHDINETLSSLGSFKLKRWSRLNAVEHGYVDEALRTIESDIQFELPGADLAAAREHRLIENRYAFFVDYLQIMSESSLLQWITADTVGIGEFKDALAQAIRMGERDLRQIAQQRAQVHFNRLRMEFHFRANDPVLYTGLVNALSLQSESNCLALLKMKKEFEQTVFEDQMVYAAASLPLMFIPGPGSMVALTLMGGAYVAQSQSQFMATQARELGVTFVDWNRIDLNALRISERTRNTDAAMVVIGAPLLKGGKFIFRTSAATLKKMNFNRSVLLKRVIGRGPV